MKEGVKEILLEWIYALLISVGIVIFGILAVLASIRITGFLGLTGILGVIITAIINFLFLSVSMYFSIKHYTKKKNSPTRFILTINSLVVLLTIILWIFMNIWEKKGI